MKRVLRGLVVAAMLSTTAVAVAPPAMAAPADCLEEWVSQPLPVPDFGTVQVNGLDVTVDPTQADEDVDKVYDFAVRVYWTVWCIEGGIVTNPYNCLAGRINTILGSIDPLNGDAHYVTRDPGTGAITIHGELLVSDVGGCLPPWLSIG